jgi:hypothetical protein
MTAAQRVKEWVRNYQACLSPGSRVGSLSGALRDGALTEVLWALKIRTPLELIESLNQERLDFREDHADAKRETAELP